jgi:large conductance mechanosensitive channel
VIKRRGGAGTMKVLTELKEFSIRGNVVDMAIGIIIGSAFSRIVSSLVNDIILPPIGVLISGVNFTRMSITIQKATEEMQAVVIGYGKFIQAVVDFVIITFVIFFVIKAVNSLRRKEEVQKNVPAAPSPQVVLLTEIRDLLKEGK